MKPSSNEVSKFKNLPQLPADLWCRPRQKCWQERYTVGMLLVRYYNEDREIDMRDQCLSLLIQDLTLLFSGRSRQKWSGRSTVTPVSRIENDSFAFSPEAFLAKICNGVMDTGYITVPPPTPPTTCTEQPRSEVPAFWSQHVRTSLGNQIRGQNSLYLYNIYICISVNNKMVLLSCVNRI